MGMIASRDVRLRAVLVEPEHERQRGHEQDPAAHAEEAGEHPRREAEGDGERRVPAAQGRTSIR